MTGSGAPVDREVKIDARPETVWDLLTDERLAVRWMGLSAAYDMRPGGAYRVEVIPGRRAVGSFIEIDPPRRLVYTWGWDGDSRIPPGSTTVEFDLVADGEGTLLRLRHRDLPDHAAETTHARGWEHYLSRLTMAAQGTDPGTDTWVADSPTSATEV
ncbi:MAG: SRPBCC family protein [Candidatus Dormibacteria bacterium]